MILPDGKGTRYGRENLSDFEIISEPYGILIEQSNKSNWEAMIYAFGESYIKKL
jgi:hypothetical protein